MEVIRYFIATLCAKETTTIRYSFTLLFYNLANLTIQRSHCLLLRYTPIVRPKVHIMSLQKILKFTQHIQSLCTCKPTSRIICDCLFPNSEVSLHFRDRSLVMGRGGGARASEVLPLQKGVGILFSHAEGRGGGGGALKVLR